MIKYRRPEPFWSTVWFVVNRDENLFAQLAVRAAMNSWVECGGSMVIITSTAGQRGSDIYSACEMRAIAPSDLPAR